MQNTSKGHTGINPYTCKLQNRHASNTNISFFNTSPQKVVKTKLKSFADINASLSAAQGQSCLDSEVDKTVLFDRLLRTRNSQFEVDSHGRDSIVSDAPSIISSTDIPNIRVEEDVVKDAGNDNIRITFDEYEEDGRFTCETQIHCSSDVRKISISVSTIDLREVEKDSMDSKDIQRQSTTCKSEDSRHMSGNLLSPASLKMSRSCVDISDDSEKGINATRHRISRKISSMFIKSNTSLNEEKRRLQKEREMLDQVQNELRRKLPKTFQVTATLCVNPQLLENRKKGFSVGITMEKPRTAGNSQGTSFIESFMGKKKDDSRTVTPPTWRAKIQDRFKPVKKPRINNSSNQQQPTDNVSSSNETLSQLVRNASVNQVVQKKMTTQTTSLRDGDMPLPLRDPMISLSDTQRDSLSSVDSGIGLKRTDSPILEDRDSQFDCLKIEGKTENLIHGSKVSQSSPRGHTKTPQIFEYSKTPPAGRREKDTILYTRSSEQNKASESEQPEQKKEPQPRTLNHDQRPQVRQRKLGVPTINTSTASRASAHVQPTRRKVSSLTINLKKNGEISDLVKE